MSFLSKLFRKDKPSKITLINKIPKLSGVSIILDGEPHLHKYKNIIYISQNNKLELPETNILKYNAKESLHLNLVQYSDYFIDWINYYVRNKYVIIFDVRDVSDSSVYRQAIKDSIKQEGNIIVISNNVDELNIELESINNIILFKNKYCKRLDHFELPKINGSQKLLIEV